MESHLLDVIDWSDQSFYCKGLVKLQNIFYENLHTDLEAWLFRHEWGFINMGWNHFLIIVLSKFKCCHLIGWIQFWTAFEECSLREAYGITRSHVSNLKWQSSAQIQNDHSLGQVIVTYFTKYYLAHRIQQPIQKQRIFYFPLFIRLQTLIFVPFLTLASTSDISRENMTKYLDAKGGLISEFFLLTVKSRAVERSTIQFWNFLVKGHST